MPPAPPFHTEDEKGKMEGQVIHYSGGDYLNCIPNRDDIIAKNDERLTAILEDALSKQQDIPFMAVDVEESTEFINGKACYVLRLYGPLINGQKAVVSIMEIRVFFDILIPDEESTDAFEAKIRGILSNAIKSFEIEHVRAFPFRGYHTEKKPYLRIYAVNTKQRKMAIKAVQKKKYVTASDDQFTYYRKVAREYGVLLSGWSTISNYTCEFGERKTLLCAYAFRVSIENFHPIEDLASLKDRFPISALMRDRTFVLTWNIETYSSCGLGEFPEAINEEDSVIMICMTLHWKDDSRPLNQICLVNVETTPDLRWITIVCESQTNLLKVFALCWRAFASDIQLGFNDSQYDWPFIMEKANKLHLIEWMWKQMSARIRQETSEDIIQ